MAAEFPAQIPDYTGMIGTETDDNFAEPSLSDFATKVAEENVALATTLGVDPQGAAASVKQRIADVENAIEGVDVADLEEGQGWIKQAGVVVPTLLESITSSVARHDQTLARARAEIELVIEGESSDLSPTDRKAAVLALVTTAGGYAADAGVTGGNAHTIIEVTTEAQYRNLLAAGNVFIRIGGDFNWGGEGSATITCGSNYTVDASGHTFVSPPLLNNSNDNGILINVKITEIAQTETRTIKWVSRGPDTAFDATTDGISFQNGAGKFLVAYCDVSDGQDGLIDATHGSAAWVGGEPLTKVTLYRTRLHDHPGPMAWQHWREIEALPGKTAQTSPTNDIPGVALPRLRTYSDLGYQSTGDPNNGKMMLINACWVTLNQCEFQGGRQRQPRVVGAVGKIGRADVVNCYWPMGWGNPEGDSSAAVEAGTNGQIHVRGCHATQFDVGDDHDWEAYRDVSENYTSLLGTTAITVTVPDNRFTTGSGGTLTYTDVTIAGYGNGGVKGGGGDALDGTSSATAPWGAADYTLTAIAASSVPATVGPVAGNTLTDIAPTVPDSPDTLPRVVRVIAAPANVIDYGAERDGTTDDIEAFKAMIAAVELAGGGKAYAPRGVYGITADGWDSPNHTSGVGIIVPAGVHLFGDGPGATVIKRLSGAIHMVNFVDAVNSSVRDLELNGNWPTNTDVGHGVHVEPSVVDGLAARNITMENLYIHHVGSYGIGVQHGDFYDVVFRDIEIADVGADGIDIKNRDDDTTGIQLTNIRVTRHGLRGNLNGQAGIDLRGHHHARNLMVLECCTAAVANDSGTPAGIIGIRARGGTVLDASGYGGHGSSVSGWHTRSVVPTTTGSMGFQLNCREYTVSDGVAEDFDNGLQAGATASDTLETSTIMGVHCLRSTVYGMRLTTSAHLISIIGSSAKDGASIGFRLEGTRLALKNSYAMRNTGVGVSVTSGCEDSYVMHNFLIGNSAGVSGTGTNNVLTPNITAAS